MVTMPPNHTVTWLIEFSSTQVLKLEISRLFLIDCSLFFTHMGRWFIDIISQMTLEFAPFSLPTAIIFLAFPHILYELLQ